MFDCLDCLYTGPLQCQWQNYSTSGAVCTLFHSCIPTWDLVFTKHRFVYCVDRPNYAIVKACKCVLNKFQSYSSIERHCNICWSPSLTRGITGLN